jgi:putative RNA 2'-phosphotransferase
MSKKHSKALSWLLRHGANESGLAMDAAGWARIDDVMRVLKITRVELDDAVRDNDKGRLVVRDEFIRACQGHSFAGTPVTREALEASWAPVVDLSRAFHGTSEEAAKSIRADRILPGERTHVHLAPTTQSKVGKRAGVAVMLEIDLDAMRAKGHGVWRSENGVILVREVPKEFLV